MAKVSFYLFEKSPERQVDSTCRLCRKILRQPERIWLLCADPALQQELDEKLWNFDPASFIPHGIDQPDATVCISAQLPEQSAGLFLILIRKHLNLMRNLVTLLRLLKTMNRPNSWDVRNINNIVALAFSQIPLSSK
jgi:DNA polymerase III, chi subunit